MRALIVEDDDLLRESIADSIKRLFECDFASDGEEGLYLALQNIYDVIILDIMMPNMDGYEVLKSIREKGIVTPVLFLTAKDSIDDKIKGFKIGADDYIIKPFFSEELLLRIEAILRRNGTILKENKIRFLELELDITKRSMTIDGSNIVLKGKQFDLMEYLINNKDVILTKEQIFDRIWGFDSDTTVNVVEVYASNLRKVLKTKGYDKYIKTIRGVGYILSEDVQDEG
ncbi:DNA-binding response regulator, OmpR family, contains REC and winged-helix (wHTH) domain [Clostridium cavendishii DSM 21758]|uniref:Stage 0 sporulation protein A homolog n=1 Tax=Clostridium cavendishii DSM 21758 TaxID=1121302 RepID=A0A1M6TFN7_9CLOT|nr:response regulator transcription factor [Clostridium cavendishii]SHK55807.1 DNA-binding response regulator, OmpR family, contains REC and winged-helix (wHTH) domain [Clostridium cavendishii DSM 21758]